MEDMEVPLEGISEGINEHAVKGEISWFSWVALSTALISVLAAVCALLAGHNANESMLAQMQATDKWAYYQAKGIKSAILSSKIELLTAIDKPVKPEDREKVEDYKKDQAEAQEEASKLEKESVERLALHNTFAHGVTLFQVAIGVSAVAILLRKRRFWLLSLVVGIIGCGFLALGLWHHFGFK